MVARTYLSTLLLALSFAVGAHGKPSFSIGNLPDTWEKGQYGTNQCSKFGNSSQKSTCQNVFINSATDFCLWGPPKQNSSVGEVEGYVVSYCTKSGYGTRLIPNGTLKSAHFVKTSKFVQITGKGDFTNIGIAKKDDGGELDPHGANGSGNPKGGLVFSRNTDGNEGNWVQLKEWNSFINDREFSIRGCFGSDATKFCPHIYDEMGDYFNSPGTYKAGVFEDCAGEPGKPPGVYGSSTFWQGQKHTPDAHEPGKTSECKTHSSVKNGPAPHKAQKRRFDSKSQFRN